MDQENNLGGQNSVIPPQQQNALTAPGDHGKEKKAIIILSALIVLIVLGGLLAVIVLKKSTSLPSNSAQIPSSTPQTTTDPVEEESFEVILEKDKKTDINFNNIYLTYMSSENPDETCFDCITSTFIRAELNDEIKDIYYDCGGITGECTVRQDFYGIGLELVQQIDLNTLIMKVYFRK